PSQSIKSPPQVVVGYRFLEQRRLVSARRKRLEESLPEYSPTGRFVRRPPQQPRQSIGPNVLHRIGPRRTLTFVICQVIAPAHQLLHSAAPQPLPELSPLINRLLRSRPQQCTSHADRRASSHHHQNA